MSKKDDCYSSKHFATAVEELDKITSVAVPQIAKQLTIIFEELQKAFKSKPFADIIIATLEAELKETPKWQAVRRRQIKRAIKNWSRK